MSNASKNDESVDIRILNNEKNSEDTNFSKVSGKTFLKFLYTAYHLNEAIEGGSKNLGINSSSDWKNLTNSDLFANLLDVEEKCVFEALKETKNFCAAKKFDLNNDSAQNNVPFEKNVTSVLPPVSSASQTSEISKSCGAAVSVPSSGTVNSGVSAISSRTVSLVHLGPLTGMSDSVKAQSTISADDLPSATYFPSSAMLGLSSLLSPEKPFTLEVKPKLKDECAWNIIENTGMEPSTFKEIKTMNLLGLRGKIQGTKLFSVEAAHEERCLRDSKNKKRLTEFHPPEVNNYVVESIIKSQLGEVLSEGVLDSVLPYLIAKYHPTNNSATQQNLRKLSSIVEGKKTDKTSGINVHTSIRESRKKNSDSSKLSKGDIEVEIHVCDEAKNLKKDFRCSQKLLVSKMGYFAEVTTGQKLEDMDISVHCDINIFEWLMRWVKKDLPPDMSTPGSDSNAAVTNAVNITPTLDSMNVVPILVSASFLQMDPLLDTCLQYCKNNMNDILKSPANLSCVNDSILTRLANMFSNTDVEGLKDKKDKIRSRLYCKLVISLCTPEPNPSKGHFSSFMNIFKCIHCKKLILPKISAIIPCVEACLRMCPSGKIIFLHDRDHDWNMTEHVENLKGELKCWRNVYWRMWAECHFLYCVSCQSYYSLYMHNKCFFHPEPPQFFSMEQQRSTTYPVGRYSCCGIKAYRYESVHQPKRGCRMKKHLPELNDDTMSTEIIKLFDTYQSLIFSSGNLSPAYDSNIKGKLSNASLTSEDECELLRSTFEEGVDWWQGIKLQLIPNNQTNRGLLVQGLHMSRDHNEVSLGTWIGLTGRSEKMIQRTNDMNVSDTSTYTTVSSWHTADDSNEEISDPDEGDDTVYSDGSGLTSQDIHTDDKYSRTASSLYNKTTHKNKKNRCAIPRTQWVSKFSTRYNQDNQRDYEECAFQSINSMLSRRVTSSNSSIERMSVFDNMSNASHSSSNTSLSLLGSICSVSSTGTALNRTTLASSNSFSSYCSTLGLSSGTNRINHPRSLLFWSSHTPIGGTYVRIENEWRETHNILSNVQTYSSNSTSNTSVSRTRSTSRMKTRPR
ncbi:uncharacterized protein LOC142322580 [Lycorma delicatula]|uniref:uncharacterized protein LOC142322580 n=1 Tax=Lycorma delicatula TaxID=130591 RepID=UPI003F5191F4